MNNTNIGLLQRSILKVLPNKNIATLAEILFLMLIGLAAITIHSRLKLQLGIPGHQGLIFIGLIMAGRLSSGRATAASLSCLTASALSFLPFWGFQNIFFPITFLIPGLLIDFILNSINYKKGKNIFFTFILFISLTGGLAYMTIPLTRLLITLITGLPFGAFVKYGYFIPITSHFIFGFVGAFIVSLAFVKRKNKL